MSWRADELKTRQLINLSTSRNKTINISPPGNGGLFLSLLVT
jgi:UDP-N-acetylglucosamine pyrophosphorylase